MIDKAIAKITDEMMKINSEFATFIEEYLTSICTSDEVAEKILNPEKTLTEFVKNITDEFREKARKGGTGLQSAGAKDQYFYDRANEYFGINAAASSKKIDIMDLL